MSEAKQKLIDERARIWKQIEEMGDDADTETITDLENEAIELSRLIQEEQYR